MTPTSTARSSPRSNASDGRSRAARQHVATRHELSLLGLSVVETLADGRARRVGDLAAELDVSQPTVSDAGIQPHKCRLIARDRDPDDLRSTLVTLTGDGTAVATGVADELPPDPAS